MLGLILCAGFGTRLGEITKDIPKCMVKVGGKPVLERIVEHFEAHGINRIVANTHWLPLRIMEYFGPRLLYTFEPELLGENKTVNYMIRWVLAGELLVVANGDTLSDINLTKMAELSLEHGKSVRFVDHGVYAGYSVVHPVYYLGDREFIDYSTEASWVDIGTPKGLKEAQKIYGEKTRSAKTRSS